VTAPVVEAPPSSAPFIRQQRAAALRRYRSSAVAVVCGLGVGAIILFWAGANPLRAYGTIVSGSFGSSFGFTELLVEMVPLLIIALGLSVAFEAHVWNVGAEGQFYVGALCGGMLAIYLPGALGALGIPLSLIAGAAGGAVWGGLVAVMRVRRGASEIITSLLLNYVAIFLFAYMIRKPLRDPKGYYPVSRPIPADVRLPTLPVVHVHAGLLIALLLVPVFVYLLRYTPFGFSLTAMGQGRETAEATGIDVAGNLLKAMAISGAAAGLAGVIQILGVQFILQSGISPGFGYTAIIVALLGRNRPIGILVASVLVSMLAIGGVALQVGQGISSAAVSTISALFILFLVVAQRLEA
jgi:simple sugar transport system permease protein